MEVGASDHLNYQLERAFVLWNAATGINDVAQVDAGEMRQTNKGIWW